MPLRKCVANKYLQTTVLSMTQHKKKNLTQNTKKGD